MGRGCRLAILALAVSGTAAADSPVYVRPFRRVVHGRFNHVAVNHRYGDVRIMGQSDSSRLVLDAVVRVRAGSVEAAEAFADGVDFDFASGRGTTVITTRYPRPVQPDPNLSYDVQIDLALPGSARLEVNNSFGDLSVTDVRGGCDLVNRFGHVELERCGRCAVTGRYGDVRMTQTEGPLLVRNAFGNVVLEEVSRQAQVTNQYGTIQAGRMHGPTLITNVLGDVRARSGAGPLTIESHLGRVSTVVAGPETDDLLIRSRLGRVELNLARGVPFNLGGRVEHGRIVPLLPAQVEESGAVESVSAQAGVDGPLIRMDGLFSDFIIRGDSEPGEE
jgi:hypothetical protein